MVFTVAIAPDSFKGTLPAVAVARAIAEGWRSVRPDDEIILAPQADGGEGTLDAIEASVTGSIRHELEKVTGPDGRATIAVWLELPGKIAVVELAQSSGLPLMRRLDALGATSRGVGEVIRAALLHGAESLIIGLGGSASTDGGSGALSALGLLLLDKQGRQVVDGGAALTHVATIDRSTLVPPPLGGVILLTDVTTPLLGSCGAAAIFGPQKGASPVQVAELDAALAHFATLLGANPTEPGSGAAGGTAYGFAAAWGAHIESGFDYIARLSGIAMRLHNADLLLTGEGHFDQQSRGGKVVGQLLATAEKFGLRTGVIAGQLSANSGTWQLSLVDLAGSVNAAMADPEKWLRLAGARAAIELASTQ